MRIWPEVVGQEISPYLADLIFIGATALAGLVFLTASTLFPALALLHSLLRDCSAPAPEAGDGPGSVHSLAREKTKNPDNRGFDFYSLFTCYAKIFPVARGLKKKLKKKF